MISKKNIALVAGGDSSEYVVSIKSAKGVYDSLDKELFNVFLVEIRGSVWEVVFPDDKRCDIDKNDFSFRYNDGKVIFDYAYIVVHGRPGEDGRLQGYFDMLGIPYSSCGVLPAALTFNKYINNQYLKSLNVRVADSIRLFNGQDIKSEDVVERLGLPVFIKPNDGGSSFGTTKVKNTEQIQEAINIAFKEGSEVIIERFIKGREVTCGCYKTGNKEVVFPITEVIPKNEFFDYDAKYNGEVTEVTPALIPADLTELIQNKTLRIYDLIGAKGIIRVDYIIPEDNEPVLLEINTNPGMTPTSFIPQQVRAAGLELREVLTEIIKDAFLTEKKG
jgi:D-alanine-D-alanine ligase